MTEMGYNFKYLVNLKDSAPRYDEAVAYLRAASASAQMHKVLIGMNGYRDMRLFGTLYDGNLLKNKIGAEIEHFDLLEIADIIKDIPQDEIDALADKIRKNWNFVRAPKEGTVENSVRLSLAFQRKIKERGYDAFSFCDVDGVKKLLKFAPAGALTLLHDEMEIPSVPENDSYGAVTQLIMKYLTGQNPAYMEFYEFTAKSALMGVPDYVPASAVDGKITVMPNAFGSFGEGLLNVSKVKTGEVTIVRLAQVGGELVIHAALGNAVTPETWEEAGWAQPAPQLPALKVLLKDTEDFADKVMCQHYIISYGDNTAIIKEFCKIAGIEII
jgi:L-fucose isomerase-like protein